jgi:polyhydroxyalkanoate synthesis regulator protein
VELVMSSAKKSIERLIKKYPNRRLYDTQTSSYITLTDVKQLVLDNEVLPSSMPNPMKI